MTPNVRRPSRRLSPEDAIVVWLRHWSGEFQNRIAAFFDVNPGRVNEVLKGQLHPESRSAALARRSSI
ncbi:hypothetical protein IPV08_03855 [Methylobacterium sp. SD274]|uniref:hypothetical protein n=1 Tax=Methylobacterium sp. SD274 TaxID=2782009 RepID=UPI001A969229|nr:hypothetical protein [Methylobacterium sp. SD274]MBO1019102.1 hypothetical protein [Methylobacterium sp. SD274]